METGKIVHQDPRGFANAANPVGDKKRPRLVQLLDEVSMLVYDTREVLSAAADAGYRLGSSSRLSEPGPPEGDRPVPHRVDDRLNKLLDDVVSLQGLAREIRDHLDSLV